MCLCLSLSHNSYDHLTPLPTTTTTTTTTGQYDMTLSCFERALSIASDDDMADVWYNLGHVGVALGDLGLAYQAFKVPCAASPLSLACASPLLLR